MNVWEELCVRFQFSNPGIRLAPDIRERTVVEDVGGRVVAAVGEQGARELIDVLQRSDADRAALIGRLHQRPDARWLAELVMDMEDDAGEAARLVLIDELRRTLEA